MTAGSMAPAQAPYDMAIVRGFALSALVWGLVGMLVGLIAALDLVWPGLNVGPLHFGRILVPRPNPPRPKSTRCWSRQPR